MRHTPIIFAWVLSAFWLIAVGWMWQQPTQLDGLEPAKLDYRINVNTADRATLELLPRIGPNIARNILAVRGSGVRFCAPDDLQRVPQIGPYTVEMVAPWISFECDENRFADEG